MALNFWFSCPAIPSQPKRSCGMVRETPAVLIPSHTHHVNEKPWCVMTRRDVINHPRQACGGVGHRHIRRLIKWKRSIIRLRRKGFRLMAYITHSLSLSIRLCSCHDPRLSSAHLLCLAWWWHAKLLFHKDSWFGGRLLASRTPSDGHKE